jgi:hypothetical protein
MGKKEIKDHNVVYGALQLRQWEENPFSYFSSDGWRKKVL